MPGWMLSQRDRRNRSRKNKAAHRENYLQASKAVKR
jgi:hypothetical protein